VIVIRSEDHSGRRRIVHRVERASNDRPSVDLRPRAIRADARVFGNGFLAAQFIPVQVEVPFSGGCIDGEPGILVPFGHPCIRDAANKAEVVARIAEVEDLPIPEPSGSNVRDQANRRFL
jgi:hypothetical protein